MGHVERPHHEDLMSISAHRIESARRLYAAALNTPAEAAAKANLERIIRESGTTAAVEIGPPDWCCGARCRHCEHGAVCK